MPHRCPTDAQWSLVFKPIDIETANGLAWGGADPFDDLFDEGGELGAYLCGGLMAEAHRRCIEEVLWLRERHLIEATQSPVLVVFGDEWRVCADVREFGANLEAAASLRNKNLCL